MNKRLDIRAASLTPSQRSYMLALDHQTVRPSPWSALSTAALLASAATVFYLAWVILA